MDDIKKTVTNLNVVKSEKKEFNWKDPLDLDRQLSEEEKLIRDTAYDMLKVVCCQELKKPF